MSTFERIVRARLEELGTNPFAVEARSPLKEGVIRNVLRGTDVRLTTAYGICDALGLELYIGPPRRDLSTPVIDPITENLAMIRRYDIVASAGNHRNRLRVLRKRLRWRNAPKPFISLASGPNMQLRLEHATGVACSEAPNAPQKPFRAALERPFEAYLKGVSRHQSQNADHRPECARRAAKCPQNARYCSFAATACTHNKSPAQPLFLRPSQLFSEHHGSSHITVVLSVSAHRRRFCSRALPDCAYARPNMPQPRALGQARGAPVFRSEINRFYLVSSPTAP